jgi:hypothetical protein
MGECLRKAKGGKSKLPMKEILGGSETTPWYSPGPKHAPQEHADHEFIRQILTRKQIGKMRDVWLSILLAQSTHLVIRRKAKGRPRKT